MTISGKYTNAGDFSEGMAFVKIDGKCGYINSRGDIAIEPEFSRCMDFDGGKAVVFRGNQKGGLIDKKGNWNIKDDKLYLRFENGVIYK